MGIIIVLIFIIALPLFFISKLKISKGQKIWWSAGFIILVLCLIIYLFIQGFEKGRDPKMPAEELHQPVK